jgi:hypothetical protein
VVDWPPRDVIGQLDGLRISDLGVVARLERKTNWSISTMFAGPAPTEMIIFLDPASKTAEDPSFSSDRVSLKCSGF